MRKLMESEDLGKFANFPTPLLSGSEEILRSLNFVDLSSSFSFDLKELHVHSYLCHHGWIGKRPSAAGSVRKKRGTDRGRALIFRILGHPSE